MASRRAHGLGIVPLQAPGQDLSTRELQVLQLIAEGLETRQIAQALYVSEETVRTHVRRLMAKLGATSRANAVAVAIRLGLMS